MIRSESYSVRQAESGVARRRSGQRTVIPSRMTVTVTDSCTWAVRLLPLSLSGSLKAEARSLAPG